jgi:hypothetical protein
MSREYDARSRVPNQQYQDNYDAIFGKAKKARKARAEKRQKSGSSGNAAQDAHEIAGDQGSGQHG